MGNAFDNNTPRVSVAAIVTKGQRVLAGRRIIGQGESCWQLPGGWMHSGESPIVAVNRELYEETNLKFDNPDLDAITNNIFPDGTHSITLFFKGECQNPADLAVREFDKCESWHWIDWQNVEGNIFLPLKLLIDSRYRPFSSRKSVLCISF
ncbi:MAG: ADP-ribose pyrophosphatase YjhB (NUDIX family) [Gammaproteobacteria bacterium]|jgi:ADP-ribose pyrophosphatase YjhB (NUDIX family)